MPARVPSLPTCRQARAHTHTIVHARAHACTRAHTHIHSSSDTRPPAGAHIFTSPRVLLIVRPRLTLGTTLAPQDPLPAAETGPLQESPLLGTVPGCPPVPLSWTAAAPAQYAAPEGVYGALSIRGGAGLGPRTLCMPALASPPLRPFILLETAQHYASTGRAGARSPRGAVQKSGLVTDATTPHARPCSTRPRPPCLPQPWKSRLNRWRGGAPSSQREPSLA